jgi:4-amino-4-deoxy-L-arabinose transferase-like glycosyltransferase
MPAATSKSFLVLFFKKEYLLLVLITALRLLVAARMPLSADEAYYRVWAHALAPGYLDHPPMVALWIRAGSAAAGDTPFGIRLLSPFSALLGSLLLACAAEDLAPGQHAGGRAVWLLNATLLLNAGAVTATPDTSLALFWTAAIAALARLVRTGHGAWWLATGAAAGLAFDSKYTAALLAPSVLLWLLLVPAMRPWLRRWQPYAAVAVAALLAAPVLGWNAEHGWISFVRQGGRTGDWHPAEAARHIAELVAGQLGLATPWLCVLFAAGVAMAARHGGWRQPGRGLLIAITLVPAAVFLQHAVGDRVQANWPAILYPGAALAAAIAPLPGRAGATALGLVLSGLVMLQAAAAPFPLPRRLDFSLIRLAGWDALAAAADQARAVARADCIAADDYGLAAELAYRTAVPVLGVEARWASFALPPAPAMCRSVLLVRSARRDGVPPRGVWPDAAACGGAVRQRAGVVAESYRFYRATTPAGAVLLPGRGR